MSLSSGEGHQSVQWDMDQLQKLWRNAEYNLSKCEVLNVGRWNVRGMTVNDKIADVWRDLVVQVLWFLKVEMQVD